MAPSWALHNTNVLPPPSHPDPSFAHLPPTHTPQPPYAPTYATQTGTAYALPPRVGNAESSMLKLGPRGPDGMPPPDGTPPQR